MSEYVYYRKNLGDADNTVPHRMDEKTVRSMLAANVRNVDRAIGTLIKGKPIRTRYATYTAERVPEKATV